MCDVLIADRLELSVSSLKALVPCIDVGGQTLSAARCEAADIRDYGQREYSFSEQAAAAEHFGVAEKRRKRLIRPAEIATDRKEMLKAHLVRVREGEGVNGHVSLRPNVRAKRATTAGRQARAGENVPRTARPGLVACRWRSA